MKLIISESKLERIVFMYLDKQKFIEVKDGKDVYLLNNEEDQYAQIKYEDDIDWVGVSNSLCNEVSRMFSISETESERFIAKWIKKRFNVKGMLVFQKYLNNNAFINLAFFIVQDNVFIIIFRLKIARREYIDTTDF